MYKLLIIEDNTEFSANLRQALLPQNWLVEIADCGLDGLQLLSATKYDFILLDWEMPDITGIEICRKFRADGGDTPIIFLTGRSEIEDKETGLDAGGDDYITKPFDVRELLARIRTINRRPRALAKDPLVVGDLRYDARLRVASNPYGKARLSFTEGTLLEYFLRHRGEYFTGEQLFLALWPSDSESSESTVKVQVAMLRKRLATINADKLVSTVKGAGYILNENYDCIQSAT
jgi:OmpR-family two-component system manganese-sensing response regulator